MRPASCPQEVSSVGGNKQVATHGGMGGGGERRLGGEGAQMRELNLPAVLRKRALKDEGWVVQAE